MLKNDELRMQNCDLRMPTAWLRGIAESIDIEESWIFKSHGGNILQVIKRIILHADREDVEVLDFTYNPEQFDYEKEAQKAIEDLEDTKMFERLEKKSNA